ncbi:hypothetical protein FZ983_28115 [Azospirillum sp. B21]|uniref:hypothetical protein n=1 Tax=Azospirillum sp. B21 TaxID=2607496 RepID=UPI0011ECCC57|nr:hypothetical protein [Azospirillum sp. B21]KAA0574400.1 hypothetical protein FZ983_28115 [Azospirillum sp. B21]
MASPVSLGLALDKGDLHVTRDLDGLLVYASGSVLRLSSARFGSADALSAPRRTGNVWTVEVAPFLLPGANPLRGTLTFRRLPDDKGGEWVVELRIHNLIRFQPVSYHEWSVGKAQLENRMSGAGGRTFLRRLLGGAFTVRGAATVTLGPDLLWKIASPAGIVAADAAVTMPAIAFGIVPLDREPNIDGLPIGPGIASQIGSFKAEVSAAEVRSKDMITLTAPDRAQVAIEARGSGGFLWSCWRRETDRSIVCLSEVKAPMAARFVVRGGDEGPFPGDRSTSWVVRIGQRTYRRIDIPVPSKVIRITTAAGSLAISGELVGEAEQGRHVDRLRLLAMGDLLTGCDGRVLVSQVPLEIGGADFSRLDMGMMPVALEMSAFPGPQPSAALGRLVLGRKRRGKDVEPDLVVPLDRSSLRLSRAVDLVRLTCRFRGVSLHVGGGAPRLRITADTTDPLMAVEFPPQHVAERTFFRQIHQEPEVLLSENEIASIPEMTPALRADRLEALKEQKDLDYKAFRARFAEAQAEKRPELSRYYGPLNREAHLSPETAKAIGDCALALLAVSNPEEGEALPDIVEARLSGPSRIVFQLRCLASAGPGGGAIPLTIEALTRWNAFDLAVVRRASRSPVRMIDSDNGTTIPELGDDLVVRMLDHYGVAPNNGTPEENWAARLRDLEKQTRPPSAFETSIELPSRLMLSPADDARFWTPDWSLASDPWLGPQGTGTVWRTRHVPLWRAELDESVGGAGTRAVWSPDLRPALFEPTPLAADPPPRGPCVPWETRKGGSDCTPGQIGRFRMPMDAYDRHEIVLLSSVHGMPVRRSQTSPTEKSWRPAGWQIPAPASYALSVSDHASDGGKSKTTETAIYVPPPFHMRELSLSSLGGSIDLDARFEPPTLLREGMNAISFSVERWRQRSVLGRDIFVEVVYKGFLFPLGMRCSLVKQTERRILAHPFGGYPVAYLVQRMFLRVGNPEKNFPPVGQPFGGRRWPVSNLRLLTTRTPDIEDPMPGDGVASTADARVQGNGRIRLPGGADRGLIFLPRTQAEKGAEVCFSILVERTDTVSMPLIFVDNVAANNQAAMRELCVYYNKLAGAGQEAKGPSRVMRYGGRSRRYAEATKPGETTFETESWTLLAEGRTAKGTAAPMEVIGANVDFSIDAIMEGADQPPFYPGIHTARIRIGQIERFSGQPTGVTTVGFPDDYLEHGLDRTRNPAEIFLHLDTTVALDLSQGGDRSGGVAQPNAPVVFLSRSIGPVGDTKLHSTPNLERFQNFQPASFFAGAGGGIGEAKLLGLIPLSKAIATITNLPMSKTAPKLKEVVDRWIDRDQVEALVRILTKNVVQPLREVNRIKLPGEVSAVGQPLYPDLDRVLTGLDDALKLFAAWPPADGSALDAPSRLYEAGGQLVAVLNRIAADPGGPIKDRTRAVLGRIPAMVEGFTVKLLDPTGTAGELVRIRETVRRGVRNLFCEPATLDWARRVVTLPMPVDTNVFQRAGLTPPDVPGIIARACETAMLKATLPEFLNALHDDVNAGLTVEIQRLRSELGNAPANVQRAVRREIARLEGELRAGARGFLYDRVEPLLRRIEVEADRLQAVVQGRAENILNSLLVPVSGFIDALTVLIAETASAGGIRRAEAACASVAEAMERAVLVMVPEAGEALCLDLAEAETLPAATACPVPPAGGSTALARSCGRLLDGLNALVCAEQDIRAYAAMHATPEPLRVLLAKPAAALGNARISLARSADVFGDSLERLIQARGAFVSAADRREVCRPGGSADVALGALATVVHARAAALEALAALGAQTATAGQLIVDAIPPEEHVFLTLAEVSEQARSRITGEVEDRMRQGLAALAPVIAAIGHTLDDLTSLARAIDREDSLLPLPDPLDSLLKRLQDAEDALRSLPGMAGSADGVAEVRQRLTSVDGQVRKEKERLDQQVAAIERELSRGTAGLESLARIVRDRRGHVLAALQAIQERWIKGVEAALLDQLTRLLAFGPDVAQRLTAELREPLAAILSVVARLYTAVADERDKIVRQMAKDNDPSNIDARLFGLFWRLFIIAGPGETIPNEPEPALEDRLRRDATRLTVLAGKTGRGEPLDTADQADLRRFVDEVNRRNGQTTSVEALVDTIGTAFEQTWRGDFSRLIDIGALLRQLEQELLKLLPSKATLSYDFDTDIAVPDELNDIFVINPADRTDGRKDLSLQTRVTIDLLDPTRRRISTTGRLGPFSVRLFGSSMFAVQLDFTEAVFRSGGGRDTFDVRVRNVVLGPLVQFIKPLEAYCSPRGKNGFFLNPRVERPGVEAGYQLNLGTISIGTLAFLNVSLNASCTLPFDNAPATFSIALSRRDAPFLISAAPYGGGGFFRLEATSDGIVGFEASFEYGGVGAFAFGPLEGQGRLTLGIYVRKAPGGATIDGFFFCGGSAHIACFGVAASLTVRISQREGGSMAGSAEFTYSFSLGFTDIDFTVTVWRQQGQGFQDDTVNQQQSALDDSRGRDFANLPDRIRVAALEAPFALAAAVAANSDPVAERRRKRKEIKKYNAVVETRTASPEADWLTYRSYFDDDLVFNEERP